jgi:dienelactone hydrolase
MRTYAHTFGPDGKLVGIVTRPAPERDVSRAPAVILANVGMHHRVGPYRLYVDLARRLAELGFTTLRFDLSGLGDSTMRTTRGDEEARFTEDMQSAMALLETKHGARSFVVLGLCSGVDPVHAIALTDDRVSAAVFVDGHAFPTRRHHLHRYVLRAARPRTWELFLKRRIPGLFGVEAGPDFATALAFQRVPMSRERFVRDLERLLERHIPLLYAFTGEQEHAFSHADQFHDMVHPLETRGRVDVRVFRRADHVFSLPDDRRAFVESTVRWIADRFPVEELAAREAPAAPMSGVRLTDEEVPASERGVRRIG